MVSEGVLINGAPCFFMLSKTGKSHRSAPSAEERGLKTEKSVLCESPILGFRCKVLQRAEKSVGYRAQNCALLYSKGAGLSYTLFTSIQVERKTPFNTAASKTKAITAPNFGLSVFYFNDPRSGDVGF